MNLQRLAMKTYSYEPLPAQHIRLLTLLPGSFKDDIHVRLHPIEIGSHESPRYHALSYVWGSTDTNDHVLVDSGESQHSLPITRNLYVALQHLRLSSRSRTMWVDAVCINQIDIEERNDQVSRMAHIYKLAQRVILWLGPAKDSSSLAMRSLEELASKFEVDWHMSELTPSTTQVTDSIWLDLNHPAPFSEVIYKAIMCFLARPWFNRLWIWQEVLLANRAHFVCGEETMTWMAFRKSVLCLQGRREPGYIKGFSRLVSRAWQICSLNSDTGPRELHLGHVLEQTKGAQCSDPRDRIYAVLNLVSEQYRYELQPNYKKSVFDVFADVVMQDIRNSGQFLLLTHCGLRDEVCTMPSWIPNWSVPKPFTTLWEPRACGKAGHEAEVLHDNVMAMTGICAAQILTCRPILPVGDAPFEKVYSWLRTTIVFASQFLDRFWPTKAQVNEIICRTLCTNLFTDRYEPMRGACLDFRETMDRFCKIRDPQNEISSDFVTDNALFLDMVRYQAQGRTLIVTDSPRFIGLAPDTCREGDRIAVLLGCPSPMVLEEEEDGNYLVLGECYVHGLMNGEALLGPLPDGWQQVFRYDENTQRYADVFGDLRHGTYQFEDPRLGDLPEGWSTMVHPSQNLLFINEQQDLKSKFDPRMRSENLRERGVELQRFYLV